MNLPRKIRIGYLDYRVTEMPAAAVTEGDHDPRKLEIRIRTKKRPRQYALNTLLHEIGHGIFYTQGLQDVPGIDGAEEMIVNIFMNGLSQVLRDNPEVRKLLRLAR